MLNIKLFTSPLTQTQSKAFSTSMQQANVGILRLRPPVTSVINLSNA